MTTFLLLVVLLAELLCVVSANTTFPQTVEVDLIFPRNDTYAPSTLFPFVFAVQNTVPAISLDLLITLSLWNTYRNDTIFSHFLKQSQINLSSGDPAYAYAFTDWLNKTDGNAPETHYLLWSVAILNCSDKSGYIKQEGRSQSKAVWFTIQNGAQQPDLIAATTGSEVCNNSNYFAFNLTGTIDYRPQLGLDNDTETCAVLSDEQPLVAGNPCAVQVGSAAASSISAAITAMACGSIKQALYTFLSCPSDNLSDNAALGGWDTRYTGYMWYYTAVFGWLVVVFIAIQWF